MTRLLIETSIIAAGMLALCALPYLSKRVRHHSKLAYLIGTGALTGILIFELLPEVFELGGQSSMMLAGAVWAVYSLAHLIHLHEHRESGDHDGSEGTIFFLASMIAHCVASGMLLVVSSDFVGGIGRTVFFALLAHKAYEALTVGSILIERQRSRPKYLASIAVYALSLPLGVAVTLIFKESIGHKVALVAMSVAVGTLLGCLIFDFLLPSIAHLRSRWRDLGWIALGLFLTQAVLRVL